VTAPSPEPEPLSGGWRQRLEDLAARSRKPANRRIQLWVFGVAACAFAVGTAFAIRDFPHTRHPADYTFLIIVFLLGPPAVVTLNSIEFTLAARLLSQKVRIGQAVRIAVLGTAANQLPVPGAVIVRTQALASGGAGYRRALLSNLAIGLAWIGTAFTMAGLLQIHGRVPALGLGFAAVGIAMLVACERVVHRASAPDGPRFMAARIMATETVLVLVQAGRLALVLHGFGVRVSPAQAIALALSAVLASALGVVPGGVGVREGLAAGIGPIVGLPASISLIATAFDRLCDLVVVGLAAVVITFVTHRAGNRVEEVSETLPG
jgi:hypothetical protein